MLPNLFTVLVDCIALMASSVSNLFYSGYGQETQMNLRVRWETLKGIRIPWDQRQDWTLLCTWCLRLFYLTHLLVMKLLNQWTHHLYYPMILTAQSTRKKIQCLPSTALYRTLRSGRGRKMKRWKEISIPRSTAIELHLDRDSKQAMPFHRRCWRNLAPSRWRQMTWKGKLIFILTTETDPFWQHGLMILELIRYYYACLLAKKEPTPVWTMAAMQ